MAALTGLLIADSYKALLKTVDNDVLGATAKEIVDGYGNVSGVLFDTSGNVTINGNFRALDAILDSSGSPGTAGQVLTTTGTTTQWQSLSSVSGVTGSGTAGYLPLWSTTSALTNSIVTQSGTTITVGGTLNVNTRINTPILQLTGGTGNQGTLSWNVDEETVDLIQNGATLQVGQELQIHCKNQTGATIPDGTPVYVTGTLGASGRLTIAPMIADGSIQAKYFIGVTTETIADGEDGKVTTFGKIRGINTAAYSEGQTLWVSATTAGAFVTTRPVAPNLDLEVAIVINSHANNGTLFVRSSIGHYLGTAHDVNISSVAENDLLVYKTNRWVNSKSIGDLSAANVTLSGYLRGPATFVIDPAAYGDETGLVQILGDLRVDGTTTTINSTTISVSDKNITLAKDAATAGDANGAGLTIAGASATLTYLSATDDFTFNKKVNATEFIGPLNGDVSGNADTASALETAVNIALDGSVTGNADFDGSGNITITTTTNHNHDDRYYTETEVGNFFSGTTAITGYNKTNWDAAYNAKINSGYFNSNNGDLVLTRQDDSTLEINFDDRYVIANTGNFKSNTYSVDSGSGTQRYLLLTTSGQVDQFFHITINRAYDYGDNDQTKQQIIYQRRNSYKNLRWRLDGDTTASQQVFIEIYAKANGDDEVWLVCTDYALPQVYVEHDGFFWNGLTTADTPTGTLIKTTELTASNKPNWEEQVGLVRTTDLYSDNTYLRGSTFVLSTNGSSYDTLVYRDGTNPHVLYAGGGTSTQWNTAFGWGNHANAGYLTSVPVPVNGDWWNEGYVRVGLDGVMEMGKYMDFHTSDSGGNADFDLRVTVSPGVFSVGGQVNATGGNSSQWNTAYGWGNHAGLYSLVGHTHDLIRHSLAAPALIDSMTSTSFRTSLFGSNTNGYAISTSRWNTTPTALSGMNNYGTLFAWSGADTHGFIAADYNAANIQVGGGYGDNITWKATLIHSGNIGSQSVSYAATSGTFNTDRTNYKGVTDNAVSGQLMWKQYGNHHTLFDASAGISPSGTTVNRHTPDNPVTVSDGDNYWGINPNIMGWNGSNTYGVKVDWSRYSETANTLDGIDSSQFLRSDESDTMSGNLTVSGNIRAGNGFQSALLVAATGTATTQNAIAIQQITPEGDTIIFGDYEPYAEYGIIARNSLDSIDFTGGTTTNSITSYNITNRSGNERTAYVKARIGLGSGEAYFGGPVGIGTTSPGAKLDVYGTGRFNANTALITDASSGGYSLIQHNYNGSAKAFSGYNSGFALYGGEAGVSTRLQSGGQYALTILTNGNVGIKTTNPGYALDVDVSTDGDWAARVRNTSSTGYGLYVEGSDNNSQYILGLHNGTAYKMVVTGDGNVGIGVTNPTYPLDLGNGGTGNSIRARRIWANGTGTDSGFSLNSTLIFEDSSNNFIITNPGSYPNASFCINTSGNVGIGTTSPNNRLTVAWTDPNVLSLYRDLDINAVGPAGMYINMGARYGSSFKDGARIIGVLDNSSTGSLFIETLRSNTMTSAVAILGNGNVGIGTTSPAYKLDVRSTGDTFALFSGGAGSTKGGIYLGNNGTQYGTLYFDNSNNNVVLNQNYPSGSLMLGTNGSTKMTILNGGNVGIGNTSPGYKLDVTGDINNYGYVIRTSIVSFPASGNHTDGVPFARIQEAWGVSMYTPDSRWAPNVMNASFLVGFVSGGTNHGVGNVKATGDVIAYASDKRLKTNIKPIENAISKVQQMNGVYYDWDLELCNKWDFHPTEKTEVGVLAQEIQAVLPEVVQQAPFDYAAGENGELVSKSGENYLTVKYEKIVPLLIEAIKEQQKQIDELKAIINGSTK